MVDTLTAFAIAQAAEARGAKHKVFDWDKAARMIKEHKPKEAIAGLQTDMEYTGGIIYEDGKINKENYTYLSSNWATPIIVLDGIAQSCFVMESDTKWDEHTKWPDSAVKILEEAAPKKTVDSLDEMEKGLPEIVGYESGDKDGK